MRPDLTIVNCTSDRIGSIRRSNCDTCSTSIKSSTNVFLVSGLRCVNSFISHFLIVKMVVATAALAKLEAQISRILTMMFYFLLIASFAASSALLKVFFLIHVIRMNCLQHSWNVHRKMRRGISSSRIFQHLQWHGQLRETSKWTDSHHVIVQSKKLPSFSKKNISLPEKMTPCSIYSYSMRLSEYIVFISFSIAWI